MKTTEKLIVNYAIKITQERIEELDCITKKYYENIEYYLTLKMGKKSVLMM